MRVYDCFIFYKEFELLEIRLATLYDHVDYFVIVEGDTTISGQPKPFYFLENRERYKQWEDKIIHVPAKMPKLRAIDRLLVWLSTKGSLYKITNKITAFGLGKWRLEHGLRNQIATGLQDAEPGDLIMVSDVDEIPNPAAFKKAAAIAKRGDVAALRQTMYLYYLNGLSNQPWAGTKMCTYETFLKRFGGSPQTMRVPLKEMIWERLFGKKLDLKYVDDAGWHFSYQGGANTVIEKKKTTSHAEISTGKDVQKSAVESDIDKGIFRYKDIVYTVKYRPLDATLPAYLVKHKSKFSHMIRPAKKARR